MRIDIIILLILPFECGVGALFSKYIKTTQSNKYLFLIPLLAVLNGLLWALLSKYTKMSLAVATVIFDTIMSMSYFIVFLLLGESINSVQIIGVGFAIISMVLLSR